MSISRKPTCKVLLVEDHPDHRKLISEHLRSNPYCKVRLETSSFASESIVLLENEKFDLVLLDLSLPDSSPEDTLRRFTEKFPALPIIVLTSLVDQQLIENAISWGAEDYLDKSFLNSELIARAMRYAIQRKETLNRLHHQNETLRAFSHTVAHEIKTPLQSVVVALHLLEEIAPVHDDEKISKLVKLGIESTSHLKSLVNELLQFAQFENDHHSDTPVAMNAVVTEALRELSGIHDMDDVTFSISEELPTILGSRLQLRQVLLNLLSNALKYRGESKLKIRVDSEETREGSVLRIEDNGRGISKENLSKVFHILFRADDAGEIPGHGLGLSFTKLIVERHGGNISVESSAGEGTTFRILFPKPGS